VKGGNRSGKTTCGVMEAIAHTLGYRPWLEEGHPDRVVRLPNGRPIPVPNKGRVVATSFDAVSQYVWPKFEEWLPEGSVVSIRKNQNQVPVEVEFSNGSIIYFLSHDQKKMAYEGTDHHWLWFDEPPPEFVYNALRRGLIDHGGHAWLTMTPIAEPWIAEVIDARCNLKDSEYRSYNYAIWDNCTVNGGTLTPEDIEDYLGSLRPEERAAREWGEFLHLTGRVFKEWIAEEPYWIPEFFIPPTWPRVCVIDPHPKKPIAVLWLAVSPDNIFYAYRDLFDPELNTVEKVANKIQQLEGWNEVAVKNWEMDPDNRSGVRYVPTPSMEPVALRIIDTSANEEEKTSGSTVKDKFSKRGLPCVNAYKRNKAAGLDSIHDALRIDTDWGSPQLVVFNVCENVKRNFELYIWDSWGSSKKQGVKEDKQEPVKNHDDFIDAIRYVYQMRVSYHGLAKESRRMSKLLDEQIEDELGLQRGLRQGDARRRANTDTPPGMHAGFQRLERSRRGGRKNRFPFS
jgi:phage terminase large subunit-like protein